MDVPNWSILTLSIFTTTLFFSTLLCLIILDCMKRCSKLRRNYFNNESQRDQNSIYNISSRVQGRNETQYPDSYLSVDQVHITNELNNKPPKYDDAPPTYEEATKLAIAQSNSIQTYEMEQAQSSNFQQQQQQQQEISNSRSTSSVTN